MKSALKNSFVKVHTKIFGHDGLKSEMLKEVQHDLPETII